MKVNIKIIKDEMEKDIKNNMVYKLQNGNGYIKEYYKNDKLKFEKM